MDTVKNSHDYSVLAISGLSNSAIIQLPFSHRVTRLFSPFPPLSFTTVSHLILFIMIPVKSDRVILRNLGSFFLFFIMTDLINLASSLSFPYESFSFWARASVQSRLSYDPSKQIPIIIYHVVFFVVNPYRGLSWFLITSKIYRHPSRQQLAAAGRSMWAILRTVSILISALWSTNRWL